jgi:hypothetical protein
MGRITLPEESESQVMKLASRTSSGTAANRISKQSLEQGVQNEESESVSPLLAIEIVEAHA